MRKDLEQYKIFNIYSSFKTLCGIFVELVFYVCLKSNGIFRIDYS